MHLNERVDNYSPQHFKKFIVANENIYWGCNKDVIFPVQLLFDEDYESNSTKEIVTLFNK